MNLKHSFLMTIFVHMSFQNHRFIFKPLLTYIRLLLPLSFLIIKCTLVKTGLIFRRWPECSGDRRPHLRMKTLQRKTSRKKSARNSLMCLTVDRAGPGWDGLLTYGCKGQRKQKNLELFLHSYLANLQC